MLMGVATVRWGATARWGWGGNSGGGQQLGGGSSTSKNRSSHHKYVSKTVRAETELKGSKSA